MSLALSIGQAAFVSRVPTDITKVVVDIGTGQLLSRIPQDADQSAPWWNEDPASWEAVYLSGKRLPGLSWIEGTLGIRVAKKKVGGVHGHTAIQYGYEAGKLTVKMVLWAKEHLQQWSEQLQVLRPRPGRGQPGAVSISHPATTLMGVNFVEVMHISLLAQDEPGMDVYNCSLELREHIPLPTGNKGKVQSYDISTRPTAIPTGTAPKTPNQPKPQVAKPPSQTNGGVK